MSIMVIDSDCLSLTITVGMILNGGKACTVPIRFHGIDKSVDEGQPWIRKWRYELLALLVIERSEDIDPRLYPMVENHM